MTKSTHTVRYKQLIEIIEDARRQSGLTQQQVADRLGKPQSFIAKVEGSERRIDVLEFIDLAKAMDFDPEALFKKLHLKISE